MISLKSKEDCCGCHACVQVCPHKCIAMTADEEGFVYPGVEASRCVDCGLCEMVCPVINQAQPRQPLECYAAYNRDKEIRLNSSSGGFFSLLAENVIKDGGVVFGAKFNENWDVVHDYTETKEGVSQFRGSKYVQSFMGDCYIKVKRFLEVGRRVLFSGTPCQIAGLRLFLRKDYTNLLTVDIICHGVPSSIVWAKYKQTIETQLGEIGYITFRGKFNGWKNYCFCALNKNVGESYLSSGMLPEKGGVYYSPYKTDDYSKAFLLNYSLRPSCYACPAKQGKSHSDITIADFWGIQHLHPDVDDDCGCNLVLINTSNGCNAVANCDCAKISTSMVEALSYNPSYATSSSKPRYRQMFFRLLANHDIKTINEIIERRQRPSIFRRIASKGKQCIVRLIGSK